MVIGSALLRAMLLNRDPERYFADQGYVTWFSFLQILIVAYFAWKIFQSRKSAVTLNNWKASYNLWAILSLGFVFLGIDELWKIHENIDLFIHDFFQIEETFITDRIDSLIVLLYALLGVSVLYWARSELKKFKSAFSLFSTAFTLIFIMILLDFLTESRHLVNWLFENPSTAEIVNTSIGIVEECCKIFAGGMFIAAFHRCLQISQTKKKPLY